MSEKEVEEMKNKAEGKTPKTPEEMLEIALDSVRLRAEFEEIIKITSTQKSADTTTPEDRWKTYKRLPEGQIIIDFKKEAVRDSEWRENDENIKGVGDDKEVVE